MTQPHPRRRVPRARRALAGLGGAALLAATLAPAAAGNDTDERFLGTAEDFGVQHPVSSEDLAGANVETAPNAWFVQFASQPTSKGGSAKSVKADQQTFAKEARAQGVEVTHTYGSLWNGVSVRGSQGAVNRAAEAAGATAVYPVAVVEAPEPQSGESPDLGTALGMTGADIVQSELGYTGEGIRVAVMDTGIDYDHPDFGGNGSNGSTSFPTERVVAGYDFVGDDFNADTSSPDYNPVPQPDGAPDDCNGHGTHVAGIVGADGVSTGVAPGVSLGAYRVFGCAGSTTSDIMLAAMEAALADDMDVLNMSIGSAFQNWPTYPTATGADALVDAGMVVVASIGNSGASGTWSAGAPGVGEKVIGTASFDNVYFTADMVVLGDVEAPYVAATGAPAPPTSGTMTLTALGAPGTPAAKACIQPIPQDLTGKAVLIERGANPADCDAAFYRKALEAQNAGAAAVVLYNNVPGMLNPTVEGEVPITIPVIFVPMEQGQAAANDIIANGDTTLTWTDETASAPSPTGGLISSFSSYGMAADLSLKPDIGAPGGNIYAPYPLEKGGYASLSGTSMAAPHVAGAVALLLEARPDTEPEAVRGILQNHADPAPWSGAPTAPYLEPVFRQGAGMLDIDDAILASAAVTPGKLSLGESVASGHVRTLTVHNDGDQAVTYDLGNEGGLATDGSPNSPGFWLPLETVSFASPTVTVPAGGSAEVTVTIADTGENTLRQYGGWITLTSGDNVLRVPYAGFDGDYQALPVLEHSTFPTMAKLGACSRLIGVDCTMGGSWSLADEGTVYTMEDGDVPTALVHLEHSVSSAEFRVYHANADGTKGEAVHPAFNVVMGADYLGRSGSANGFTPWAWDGTREHNRGNDKRKVVPDGSYVLELTVVKALGDPSNPNHVETWTSPAFTIDRN